MATGPSDRIARILADIRPETAILGRTRPPVSLAQRMADCATPGVSVAAIAGGEVVWSDGFGETTPGTGAAVGARTLFQSGSISKAVFALAVMRLVEEGKLDLDDDVNDRLESWRVPANDGWQPRITLRQLLSHTAGTTVHGFPGYPRAAPHPSVAQILDGVPPANTQAVVVDWLPGTQFRYSGGGTTIAHLLVADVTGQPFPELMRALVLDPAGMADSTFAQPLPPALAARAAAAHPWNGRQTPGGWHEYPEMAAAGLWTTAGDLARLGAAVLRCLGGGRSPLGLKPETLTAMLRPQLPDQKPGSDFVGLGWFCNGEGDAFHFGHQGSNVGFQAELKLFPALGAGAAVLINSIQGWPLRTEILTAIGREFEWPAGNEAPMAVALPSLTGFAGIFRSDEGHEAEFASAAAGLTLRFGRQAPVALSAISAAAFFAPDLNVHVRFEQGDSGTFAVASLIQGGKTIRLLRRV